jgi:hypothetical protein
MRATATIRNKPNNNMALRMQPSRNRSREKQAEAMTPPKQPLPALAVPRADKQTVEIWGVHIATTGTNLQGQH